jgi:hypothetical protein
MARGRVRLLEPFRDFRVFVRDYTGSPEHRRLWEVVPSEDRKPITAEDLRAYVEELQRQYPDRGFYLERRELDRTVYWVLSRKNVRGVRDAVSIYFPEDGDGMIRKALFPAFYVKNRRKLVNFLVLRVLGKFGWVRKVYIGLL